jgi:hypothetical protein
MVAGFVMTKRAGGGVRKFDGDQGTKQVRLHADLVEMISWITRLDGSSSATLLDSLIRPQITARYKLIEKDIEAIKKLESKHQPESADDI